jgi:tetratricopeptide (TPR) repeat protein
MNRTLSSALSLALPALLFGFAAACASSESPDEPMSWSDNTADSGDLAALGYTSSQEPSPSGTQNGGLVGDMQGELNLREQKVKLMVDDRISRARMAYADGRLLEAEDDLLAALQLDPSSSDARRLLEQVQVAQGKASVDLMDSSDDVHARLQARATRERADVDAHIAAGREQLNDGNFDSAIGKFATALAVMEGSQLGQDWSSEMATATSLMASATESRDLQMAAQRDSEAAETFARLQDQRRMEEERRRLRLDAMLADAMDAFTAKNYDDAVDLCDDIIREDPLDARARELRSDSLKARHNQLDADWVIAREERFRLWNEDIQEARILNNEIMTDPDPAHWARIAKLRKRFRETGAGLSTDPETLALQEDIRSQRIPSLIFDGETSLQTVVDQLRTFTSIPFVVTPDAVAAVDDEGIEFNLDMKTELSVANALAIISEAAGPSVTYTFRNGVVYITSVDKAFSNLTLLPHDVRDLTALMVDFAGPKIQEIRLPDGDYNDDDGPQFGGVVGDAVPIMDPDNLKLLVTQAIAPASWEEIEGVSIEVQNGQLFVRHTAEVHAEIDAFLEELRRYTSSMVNIEARFLTVTKDYLQEIGVDWRGNGGNGSALDLVTLDDVTSGFDDNASLALDNDGPGLPAGADSNPSAGAYFDQFGNGDVRARTENILGDYGSRLGVTGGLTMQFSFLDDLQYSLILRALEKNQQVSELTSTSLSAQNTQRAYATMLNQITYVQDFDVEVALASFIADPIVGVISDGIVLDVRPTIAQNRKYITLELRPTVATLVRPISTFTSSLASLTTPITIQLPELQIASANTTVVVPDGGTVVIGGLKKLFNIDQRSEIPFLSDIPVLSLLFKTEGEAEENQDVILMIRATIVDANEMKDRLDALGR